MHITPADMYALLAENGITSSNEGQVRGFKDGNLRSKTAYAHIAALFNIFGLTEDMKQVLRYMALIGSTPFQKNAFIEIIGISDLPVEALDSMIQQGWIQMTLISEIEVMNLHPLICEVLCNELKPDVEKCEDILFIASATIDTLTDISASQRQLEIAWIDHLVHHIHGMDDGLCYIMEKLNDKIYMVEEDYQNAEWCCLRIIEMINALGMQEKYALQILDCYLYLQKIAEETGRPEMQAEYLRLAEEMQTPDSQIQMCARQYHLSYLDGKYEDAIQAAKEWLQIAEETGRSMDIGRAYHKMAFAEEKLSDEKAAFSHQMKAAEQLEKCIAELETNPDSLESDLIEAHSYVGTACYYCKQYERAQGHYEKAIELTIAEHGEESAALIDLYVKIAPIYAAQDHGDIALSKYQDAAEIAVNVYGEIHPQTIQLYNRIVNSAFEYADEHNCEELYEAAAEYSFKQFEAQKEQSDESSDCADTLLFYALIMQRLDRKSDAFRAMRNAYSIYHQLLEHDAKEWGDYYHISAGILSSFDEKENAKKHAQKAITIFQQHDDEKSLADVKELMETMG